MPDFKPIETQEAFDAMIRERLERNTRSVTAEVTKKFEGWISPEDAKKDTDPLHQQIAALTEQIKGHETTIADLTAKNTAHETAAVKRRIAHELGIPFEMADRLSGSTEDEIRADAEALSKFVTGSVQPAPMYSAETPPSNTTDAALKKMLHDMKQNART